MIVKVSIPEGSGVAAIDTRDGKIHMEVPVDIVQRRFKGKERVGFFRAEDDPNSGSIEIGDRVPDQPW